MSRRDAKRAVTLDDNIFNQFYRLPKLDVWSPRPRPPPHA